MEDGWASDPLGSRDDWSLSHMMPRGVLSEGARNLEFVQRKNESKEALQNIDFYGCVLKCLMVHFGRNLKESL